MPNATGVAEQLYELVRTGVADERIDPAINSDRVVEIANETVRQHGREAAVGAATPLGNPADMVDRLVRMVCAYGPLTEAIANPHMEEILIEGDQVFLISEGRLRGLVEPTTEAMNRHVIERLLGETRLALDPSCPLVQAQVLDGGARLTAAIPPVADHLSATLRLYRERRVALTDLVEWDTLSPAAANFLTLLMWSLGSVVVSGAPAAGKTTCLSALLSAIRPNHCVRVCEEYRELYLPVPFGSTYRCRPADPDGRGAITLRDLVKFVLGMRADFIAVGEVRSAESFELTRATHAGTGFGCTLHANSAADALEALVMTALGAGENVNERAVRMSFASAIDVMVHLKRDDPNLVAEGDPYRRQVTEIRAMAPQLSSEQFSTEAIFERKGGLGSPMVWTGKLPETALVERLERHLPKRRRLHQVLEGRVGLG